MGLFGVSKQSYDNLGAEFWKLFERNLAYQDENKALRKELTELKSQRESHYVTVEGLAEILGDQGTWDRVANQIDRALDRHYKASGNL